MQAGKVVQCQLGKTSTINGASLQRSALSSLLRPNFTNRAPCLHRFRTGPLTSVSAASGGTFGTSPEPSSQPQEYTPFPRLHERDPYRLLGIAQDAGFQEVQDARNFLYSQYKWHEPSREAIELALDSILEEKFKHRQKVGFRPPRSRRIAEASPSSEGGGGVIGETLRSFIDSGVTLRTIVNEGIVYIGLAFWAMYSTDQSFPLAGAVAYSVYMFQAKRAKRTPEGPFLGGNPMVGAILTTVINLGFAIGVMTLLTTPLAAIVSVNVRQLSGFMVVIILGVLGIYLK